MITGGCHAADIARYLKGVEVAEVFAYRCRNREDFDYPAGWMDQKSHGKMESGSSQ